VTWTGLATLYTGLRQLPDDLAQQAEPIVTRHAQQAQLEVRAGYPQGETGNLRAGVSLRPGRRTRFGPSQVVVSGAPHAHLFERGTRRRTTSRGAHRGRMPAAAEAQRMIPKVRRIRGRMLEELADMVRRFGFEVER